MERRYSNTILNLLIALAVSVIINFSYALLFLVERPSDNINPLNNRREMVVREGVLTISSDGHGYVIDTKNSDSIYVTLNRVRRFGLQEGDRLKVSVMPPYRDGGHDRLEELLERNGERFDYGTIYSRPKELRLFALQIFYFITVAFVMLTIQTRAPRKERESWGYWRRAASCLLVALLCYFLAPVAVWPRGSITVIAAAARWLDYNMILKCSFALVVVLLYGRIYQLIGQQQEIELENEHLKNENLSTRYNMLVSQINPHFFFNSLNSLAMLVREDDKEKSLTYIDRLSYTFRYIIQNGQNTLSTLDEELHFADAYSYLFRIRYADKLFFDVETDKSFGAWNLPALTLQPLIGNAVKHNTITKNKPFHISIRTEGEYLVVSNPIVPKLEPEPGTGIGLKNLDDRYRLITGRGIEITNDGQTFTVRLPLTKPDKQ